MRNPLLGQSIENIYIYINKYIHIYINIFLGGSFTKLGIPKSSKLVNFSVGKAIVIVGVPKF